MTCSPRLHRWCDSQRTVDTAQVVVREVQGDGGFQVRQFLAESVCEARKAAKLHSHRQILPLNKTCRNVFGIGVTLSHLGYNPRNAWWGVSCLRAVELAVVAKHFRQLPEVHVCTETLSNPHGVVIEAVCSELHAVSKALVQVPHEGPRIRTNALADAQRRNEFCFRVNRNVNPLIA